MSNPPKRRVAAAAKKTVVITARVTREEGELVERLVRMHDPPTQSAWLRSVLSDVFDRPMPRPAEK